MAFDKANLVRVFLGASGFSQWHYNAGMDDPTELDYFDGAVGMIRPGDVVMITTRGEASFHNMLWTFNVTANYHVKIHRS